MPRPSAAHGDALEVPSFFTVRTLPVPPQLAHWIEHAWLNQATQDSRAYRFYRGPEMVSHLAVLIDSEEPIQSRVSAASESARICVSGSHARLHAVPFPVREALVLQLRPGAQRALGLNACDVANRVVDIEELAAPWGRGLAVRMIGEQALADRLSVLYEALTEQLYRNDDRGRIVQLAAACAAACSAGTRARDLAISIGYSERQLRRIFLDLFGLCPKEVSSLVRMHALLQNAETSLGWADTACKHGFHDQSHLIYEFHRLIGTTPERFARMLAAPAPVGGAVVVHGEVTTLQPQASDAD